MRALHHVRRRGDGVRAGGNQEKAAIGTIDGCDGVADGGQEPLGRGPPGRGGGQDQGKVPGSR